MEGARRNPCGVGGIGIWENVSLSFRVPFGKLWKRQVVAARSAGFSRINLVLFSPSAIFARQKLRLTHITPYNSQ